MFTALAPAASAAVSFPSRRSSRDGPPVRSVGFAHPRQRRVAASATFAASVPPCRRRDGHFGVGRARVFFSGNASSERDRLRVRVSASASDGDRDPDGDDVTREPPRFAGAPMDPESAHGQMLAHVLDNESHLFTAAVEATLDRLSEELDAEEQREGSVDVTNDEGEPGKNKKATADSGGLVLFKRIQQMRALERRNGVQDVMYANI
jgi:hypothetical protein